jgi:gas vesicle protein GvpL/GvpF
MAAGSVYVYGIVRAGHPLPAGCRGLGDPPTRLRTLRTGELAAVVSEPPDSLLARRRDLLAHQDTLLALSADGPVAPMRFGMVAPDEAAVLGQLAGSLDEHLATLERLDGRLEMNLKVFPVEETLAGLLRADPKLRRLRDAARYRPGYEASVRLGEAVAGALRRRTAGAAAEALRALAPLAEATAAGPDVADCAGNTSFLLPRSQEAGFRAEAARRTAALRDRAELRLTGPLPCFSFVPPARVGTPPATVRRS